MGTEPIGLAGLARDRLGTLAGILPIIRDRKSGSSLLGTNRRIIGLDSDTLILARMRGDEPIPEACYEPDGLKPLLALRKLRRPKVVPIESVTEVWVGRPTLLEGKRRFRVRSSGGTTRFDLPDFESPNLIRVLQALLGDRVVLGTTTGFHLGIAPLVIQVIYLALAVLLITNEGRPALPAVALLGVFFVGALVVQILDNVPRRSWTWPWTRWGAGKAGVPPIRARLGLVLRLVGALGLVTVFLSSADESLYLVGLAVPSPRLPSVARDARLAVADDPRPPILYLRSFRREGKSNLNPGPGSPPWAGVGTIRGSMPSTPVPAALQPAPDPPPADRPGEGRRPGRGAARPLLPPSGAFVAIGEPGEPRRARRRAEDARQPRDMAADGVKT